MIKNKQKADETNLNAAFPSRTVDTSLAGVVSLTNTANANSGSTVTNTQRAINETFDAVGITGEGDATRKQYSSTNYIASGDSHKAAIGKLDARAKAQSQEVPTDINAIPGTVTIAKGGTGQTSKAPAFDALTPATTEGDFVLRGTSASVRFPVGTTGQVITADTTVSGKVKWATPATPTNQDLGSPTGTLPITNGGTGQTTKATAFDALSPSTTEGDLNVRGATASTRLGIGTTGYVLTADTTIAGKVKWAPAPGGDLSTASGTLGIANGGTGQTNKTAAYDALNPNTTKGDIVARNATTNVRVPVGVQGHVLTVDTGSDAGVKWTESVGGAFSYLANGDYEAGIADVQYASATLTNGIPTGTPTLTSSPSSITLSAETTAPLRKTTSLRATAASAWTAGQGFALGPVFTVQPSDLAKNLVAQVTYQVASGAGNLQYAGKIGTQSLSIAIFDLVTASFIPIPNGALNFSTSQGTQVVQAQFQSSAVVGQQYQVFVFNLITSGGAVAVLFDERKVYPADVPSDARTVLFVGTPVGGSLASGANLPLNTTKDSTSSWTGTTYVVNQAGDFTIAGTIVSGSVAHSYIAYVNGTIACIIGLNNTANAIRIPLTGQLPNLKAQDVVTIRPDANITVTASTQDRIAITRIGGTAASVGDARVVVGRFSTNAARAMSTASPILVYDIVEADTHGAYNAATGAYTIPRTGYFRPTGTFKTASKAETSGFLNSIGVYKNGTQIGSLASVRVSASATLISEATGSMPAFFALANDVITFRGYADASGTLISNAAALNVVGIEQVTGPSVISQAESVNVIANLSTGQAVPNNTATTVLYTTRIRDSHNQFANGICTLSMSGVFEVTASAGFIANATGSLRYITVVQSGSATTSYISPTRPPTTGADNVVAVTGQFVAQVGDTFRANVIQDSGGSLSLQSSAAENFILIKRIGN